MTFWPVDVFVECPKCHSPSARCVTEDRDIMIKCLCGHLSVVASTMEDGVVVEHTELKETVNLPRKGSKLYICLVELAGLRKASTADIATSVFRYRHFFLSTSDAASYMTILRYKGLVEPIEERKGISGGSIWVLTKEALVLLKGVAECR